METLSKQQGESPAKFDIRNQIETSAQTGTAFSIELNSAIDQLGILKGMNQISPTVISCYFIHNRSFCDLPTSRPIVALVTFYFGYYLITFGDSPCTLR